MYLARHRIRNKTHYSIRHSYAADGGYKSRNLYDLGTDPEKYVVYPGGCSYYFAPIIEDTLSEKGVTVDQASLEDIFFEFLRPDIQRVISGFDRRRRANTAHDPGIGTSPQQPIHLFDKRRYHFLRFGYSQQKHIGRVPVKVFKLLQCKSRDELEHYFLEQEIKLPANEKALYVAVIFGLNQWSPDGGSDRSWRDQLDATFMSALCRLNADPAFVCGIPAFSGLSTYLTRYAILFFDYAPPARSAEQEYIRDYINRHRVHHPPASVRVKMEEAEKLFGRNWKTLKKMNRSQFTRIYRRQALKHHPDQGGDPRIFRRLTRYYQVLMNRKAADP